MIPGRSREIPRSSWMMRGGSSYDCWRITPDTQRIFQGEKGVSYGGWSFLSAPWSAMRWRGSATAMWPFAVKRAAPGCGLCRSRALDGH